MASGGDRAPVIDGRAYRICMAHALRYYDRPVLGVMVGVQATGAITHCFPVTHSQLTSPILTIALEIVTRVSRVTVSRSSNDYRDQIGLHCKTLGDGVGIVGVYQGAELLDDESVGMGAIAVARTIGNGALICVVGRRCRPC